jgi:UDP-N-acetylglucosamine transferase subunit ALG13
VSPSTSAQPFLLVTVGTDHHPFARLLDWVGHWSAAHPSWQVAVQHGGTPAPGYGRTFAYCGHEELLGLIAAADVVVTHGGPATITQARAAGHVPVVVPRQPALGEHVDDHQVLFARRLGAAGVVHLAESEAALAAAVDAARAGAHGGRPAAAGGVPAVPPGVLKVGLVVEQLVEGRRRGTRRPLGPA